MRLTIKVKLLASFAVVLILMVVMGLISSNMLSEIEEVNQRVISSMEDAQFTVQGELDHVQWLNELSGTIMFDQDFHGELDHTECRFGNWFYDVLESEEFGDMSSDFQRMFLDIEDPHRLLHQSAHDISEILADQSLSDEERLREANSIYQNESQVQIREVRGLLSSIRDSLDVENQALMELSQERGSFARRMIVVVSIIALLIGIAIAFILNSQITNPINEIVDFLKELAQEDGDLTKRIDVKSKDEIADLAYWFNTFIGGLHDIISNIKRSSEMVTSSSNEISDGNQELSQRTQEQASSLEEVSATIEEITASIEEVASSSKSSEQLSNVTMNTVEEGASVVDRTMESMSGITTSSKEIEGIIKVINDIAFQTNLLALNAAVEAARAGEHGKGFAVVAAEVRNLAGRTAQSAEEIEGLISKIIEQIGEGNHLVGKTGKSLGEIVENSKKTSQAITEIASAMDEQSSAAGQIQSAVEELDQVTQQNASMVEEIASSSESLNSQAFDMSKVVGGFKLMDNDDRS